MISVEGMLNATKKEFRVCVLCKPMAASKVRIKFLILDRCAECAELIFSFLSSNSFLDFILKA